MRIAIGTYINFCLFSGANTGYAFQNFHAGELRTFEGINFMYGGFGFSGTSVDLEGSNIQAQVVFGSSPLDLAFVKQAADDRWTIRIRTVWLDPDTLVETSTYTEEIYQISSYQHDNSRLTLQLGSALDAVSSHVPKRTLRQALVGSLPSSGEIGFS
jgi:hypothetical protein